MVVTGDSARYRYISTVGSGGMGRVDLAEDTLLGRRVALKRLGGPADPRGLARLRREALAGASVSHVNVVSVYDVVTSDDGHLVVVMEYIAGRTLREELKRRHKLPPADALRVLEGVAAGLDAIHGRGIVHRDVKPSNILLGDDGAVKVADLGIAAVPDRTRITTSGAVVGSLSYMAPEQLDASPSTPAIDIYALSAVAYEVLSGQKARRETNAVTLAHAIATQSPPDLRNVWHQAPPGAADLLVRGMARHPTERPASAGELVRRLRAALAAELSTSILNSSPAAGAGELQAQRHHLPAPTPARSRQVPAAGPAPRAGGVAADGRTTSRPRTSDPRAPSRRPSDDAGSRPASVVAATDAAPHHQPGTSGRGSDRGRQEDRFGLAGGGGRGGQRSSSPRRLAVAGLLALVAVGVALAILLNSSGSSSDRTRQAASGKREGRTTATRHRHNTTTTQTSSESGSTATRGITSDSATTPASGDTATTTGTSTGSSAAPPASTSTASSAPAGGPAATALTSAGTPVAAVEAFYHAAAAHDYAKAWTLADPTLRSQVEGYQSFAAGQAGDRSITFDSSKVIRQSSSGATVAVQTTAVRDDGTKHCAGTVDLVPAGGGQWQLHLLHINCA